MKDKQIQDFYEFASFRLDVKQCRLTFDGETISLTPKEFDVLLFLIENSDRTVEKDELLDEIWKDTFVEEATLTRNISWLRKKLAAHTDAKIIETIPKRGYRFLPEIDSVGENALAVSKSENVEVAQSFDENVLPFSGNGVHLTEQTVRHFQIEEVLEISPSSDDLEISIVDGKIVEQPKNRKSLPAGLKKHRISIFWLVPAALIFVLLGFTAYRSIPFGSGTQIILASKIAPFSGLPGRENSPAFSPDGKSIVFAWDGGVDGENSDIYVKLIGAGEPVRLTETAAEEINPTFSPNGKSVAFVRVLPDHNEIILIPALGGAERKLYEKASYASVSFSPDGKSLAFAELDAAGNQAGIYALNIETGAKTKLTAPENPTVDHTPRFSPDGKNLAFIRYFSSLKREIFVVPANGGEARQITADNVRIYGLAWNENSRELFFTSFRGNDQMNVWKISTDAQAAPEMISTGSKNLEDLAVSPDGKTLAFVEAITDENIREFDGQKFSPLIRSIRADHSPQFSPDGRQIVFASDRTGNYEIWIADADGKNQRQLTDTKQSAGSPRFSPDGKFVAFDIQTAGNSDVYIISVNGESPRRLTENAGSNSLPAWSADGNSIFFNSNRSGSEQIWKTFADGSGNSSQITQQGAFEIFAAPDGKTIIYSKAVGKSGLWQINADGTDEKPIPELAGVGFWRSWTVAADGVYFTNPNKKQSFDINVFDLKTRRTTKITESTKSPLTYYSNLSVSNDGGKILYAQEDRSASNVLLARLDE